MCRALQRAPPTKPKRLSSPIEQPCVFPFDQHPCRRGKPRPLPKPLHDVPRRRPTHCRKRVRRHGDAAHLFQPVEQIDVASHPLVGRRNVASSPRGRRGFSSAHRRSTLATGGQRYSSLPWGTASRPPPRTETGPLRTKKAQLEYPRSTQPQARCRDGAPPDTRNPIPHDIVSDSRSRGKPMHGRRDRTIGL